MTQTQIKEIEQAAVRLNSLSPDVQAAVIRIHLDGSRDRRASKEARTLEGERARTLAKLVGMDLRLVHDIPSRVLLQNAQRK